MFEMHFTVYKIYYYRSSCSLSMPYRSGSDWRPVRAEPHRGHAQPLQGSRPQEAEGWRGDRGRGRGVGTPAVSRHQVSNIIIIIITIIIMTFIIAMISIIVTTLMVVGRSCYHKDREISKRINTAAKLRPKADGRIQQQTPEVGWESPLMICCSWLLIKLCLCKYFFWTSKKKLSVRKF